ncbi:MAG: DNA-binding protein [Pseudomonas sp.]|uniref:DNA-binding protein n=1 Tax=Pseudomonas sp. TaxID=306 RepID=UPI0030F36C54
MTLENLLAISRLQALNPDKHAIAKLLAAATRNLMDAQLPALSANNRFDAGYKVILQCAVIGLQANGYRLSTSQPGHHQTAIQTLPKSMGISQDVAILLDALRKRRNLNDYDGDPIPDGALASCLKEAELLLAHTRRWLQTQHPELLD